MNGTSTADYKWRPIQRKSTRNKRDIMLWILLQTGRNGLPVIWNAKKRPVHDSDVNIAQLSPAGTQGRASLQRVSCRVGSLTCHVPWRNIEWEHIYERRIGNLRNEIWFESSYDLPGRKGGYSQDKITDLRAQIRSWYLWSRGRSVD
jgi:hypothetical protein